MTTRWEVERAVRESGLPPLARLILLTLATYTDRGGVDVSPQYGPSLTALAAATGLDRTTVARHLNRLERAGWVVRNRPPVELARSRGARTGYRLHPVGSGTQPPPKPDGSGTVHLPVVAQDHMGSGTVPPSPEASRTKPAAAARIIIEKTDATATEAAAVVELIQRERQPRNLPALVRRIADDGELPDWLAKVRAETGRAERDAAYRAGWTCHRCGNRNRIDAPQPTCRQCDHTACQQCQTPGPSAAWWES